MVLLLVLLELLRNLFKMEFKKEEIKTKEEARQKAVDFQGWVSEENLSYSELADFNVYFEELARRFNLSDEFKENGII